ncbi:MAG TPA: DUF4397 domain-containing protein [Solirubrobacteraceae bacterium]
MRKLLSLLAVLTALAALIIAPSAQAHGFGFPAPRAAKLSLVHGIPGDSLGASRALPVQIRVYRLFDGVKVFNDVPFGTATDTLTVKPGIYRIQVRVNEAPVTLTRWTYIGPGQNVTAVAYLTDSGRLSNPAGKPQPRLGIFTNDTSDPGAGNARVIVRHLADAPAVDVLAGKSTLINALSNGSSATAVVPAGTYPISVVADADNSIVALPPTNLSFGAGSTTVVYATGSFFDGSFTPQVKVVS